MKFTLYLLIAFVFAFTSALPKDVSGYQHLSSEKEMERLDLSEIEDALKEACQYKWACDDACTWYSDLCPLCKVCDLI